MWTSDSILLRSAALRCAALPLLLPLQAPSM